MWLHLRARWAALPVWARWVLALYIVGFQAGMIHAGKTATVICENNHFQVIIDGETAAVVPRTTTSEIHRYKANSTQRSLATPAQGNYSSGEAT